MTRVTGHNWCVIWNNPYTEPPDGMDRVQINVFSSRSTRYKPPEVLAKFEELGGCGSRWAIGCGAVTHQTRKLSLNQKRKLRRTLLWNRLQKKHPLFVDQFYEEALRKKPDYYGVTGMKKLPRPKEQRRKL